MAKRKAKLKKLRKRQFIQNEKRSFNKRAGRKLLTRHHLKPKSRGGELIENNILRMYRDKHDAWHKLFKNLTLEEAIAVLQRIKKMKNYTE